MRGRRGAPARILTWILHYLLCGGFRGSDAQAARGHLAGAVHAELVQNFGAWAEVGGETFVEPGDVEEDVAAAVIGAEESEALGFEISDHAAGLLAGRGFAREIALFSGGRRGLAGFIADSLLDQSEIGVGQFDGRCGIGGDLEVRITFPGLLK